MSAGGAPGRVSWSYALMGFGLLLACCGPLLAASSSVYSFFTFPKLLCLSVGTLLAWGGLALSPQPPQPGRWPLAAPVAACGLALALSAAGSRDPALSLVGDLRLCAYGALQLGLLAALHYAAVAARPWVGTQLLVASTVAGAAAVAIYGLCQKSGIELMPGLPPGLPEGRITALQGSPVFLGASLLMALPGALLFADSPRPVQRRCGAAAGALIAAGIFLTYSRAAWAGAAISCAAYALLRAPLPMILKRRWIAAASAGLLLAAALGWTAISAQRRAVGASDSARIQLWSATLRLFVRHPILGSGPDTFEGALGPIKDDAFLSSVGLRHMANHAHNDLLQALATTGLAGLAAYLWLQWALLRAARDAVGGAERKEAAALSAALLGLFIQMKMNPAPLASLSIAAVFSGLLLPQAVRAPRLPSVLLCLPLAAAAVLSVFLFRSDAAFLRGVKALKSGRPAEALDEFRAASRSNPAGTRYWMAEVDALHALARVEKDRERNRGLLEEAVASARRAVAWRPGAVEGHNLLGVCLLRLSQTGRPELLTEADAVLSRALAMDKGSAVVRANAQLVARFRGQVEREAELGAELARLRRLAP